MKPNFATVILVGSFLAALILPTACSGDGSDATDRATLCARLDSALASLLGDEGELFPSETTLTACSDEELLLFVETANCYVHAGQDEEAVARCEAAGAPEVSDACQVQADALFTPTPTNASFSSWETYEQGGLPPICDNDATREIAERRCYCYYVDSYYVASSTGCVELVNTCDRPVEVWRTNHACLTAMGSVGGCFIRGGYRCSGGDWSKYCPNAPDDSIWGPGEDAKFDIKSAVCLCTYREDAACLKTRHRIAGGGCGCHEDWRIKPCVKCK